ncbi:MAG: phosphatidylglycerophosphatase A [Desulfobacterales bacterium]|jgi:phosphatidylglycerophosphatase A|nr:phosphatidylglycerophosphatase A [Desulfobacterales bacterium]MDH4010962.1 phosphatidylglycerophosphatase A [Desulfobacterales bacterium]
MKFRERAVLFVATGFFIGTVPFAPGTFGTLIGLPVCFLLSRLNFLQSVICILVFIPFAIWIASAAEKILRQKDPGQIVIDEIVGLIITFVGLPFNLKTVLAGFIIFRVLDILKPFPIRTLEKRVGGGSGVVLDDVLAGVYGNLILRLVIFITDII